MIETSLLFFDELRRTFRIVDAVDILLVSVFLYVSLLWFQRTASRGVLSGVTALAAVYFIARGLDMYLTALVFHTTFAILLFVLVVVFQEDLRRLFEHISALRSVRFRQTSDIDIDLDELVESMFHLAGSRTGALIVLRGKEPLARHLNGGVALGGRISRPLLYSIFDAHTPGHDGAVILDHERIEQFAAHLPISKNNQEIAGRGTRHSAALGLSECSDSLTIVVSEERGVVSVAEAGVLTEMATATELRQRLDEFFANRFPRVAQPVWERFIIQHGQLKILALTIAVLAWFVLAYDPHTVQRTFVIPTEYRNLPAALLLDETAPNEARVTLSGSDRNFRFLDPGSLKVTLDLAEARAGYQEFPITERNIRLPLNLVPYRIEPRIIRLYLREQRPDSYVPTPAN
ncbi:MAG: DNA integrity scanning protein DisA nucleotide-binding domain protein [Planctomycetaceae bacterium]|nr:diadenylate cyclase [Planctomycetales bacterium]MCB9873254.1 DNA integrity scanning protein DisA nucleotide-binding domain protein [Planctomycetaceae bacterium]MCB9939447.1 DNA integrity scanning protein DisA nucleotide-binding domain protein [Planctomycetaceae bacterium]HRX77450.1 diadenylate cyclase [Pirellulaceae bacterium]